MAKPDAKVTVPGLVEMKAAGQKITMLTACDWMWGGLVDAAGVDGILVGDSLAMVAQGHENSLPVTMDEMVYHTKLVTRGVRRALVVGDMPFMSYQVSAEQAVANAGRFLKEAGADAVKLEGGRRVADAIEAVARADIPVMAHVGLTPQSVHKLGGFKVQRAEDSLLADARAVRDAGAFAVVLEAVPATLAERVTAELDIPTIGIGAGPSCDGQILVSHDVLGLFERFVPKFVKQYAQLRDPIIDALRRYTTDVRAGQFPAGEHTFK